MNYKEKSVMYIATGSFVGYIPFAPGTFGTALGLFFCFILSFIDLPASLFLVLLFILFSIWISHKAEKILKKKDAGCIVIDEIAGIMVTFLGLQFHIWSALAGFIIFRFFDILKPFPIRTIERKLTGGAGIVADDVAAGLLSNIFLRVFFVVTGTT